jgi:hypothetical protein
MTRSGVRSLIVELWMWKALYWAIIVGIFVGIEAYFRWYERRAREAVEDRIMDSIGKTETTEEVRSKCQDRS